MVWVIWMRRGREGRKEGGRKGGEGGSKLKMKIYLVIMHKRTRKQKRTQMNKPITGAYACYDISRNT